MSPSAITRSGGCSLNGCRVFSPARTMRRCQCAFTPSSSAARSRISSDSSFSPTPGRIKPRCSISSNSCAALAWASSNRSARTLSSVTASMLRARRSLAATAGAHLRRQNRKASDTPTVPWFVKSRRSAPRSSRRRPRRGLSWTLPSKIAFVAFRTLQTADHGSRRATVLRRCMPRSACPRLHLDQIGVHGCGQLKRPAPGLCGAGSVEPWCVI